MVSRGASHLFLGESFCTGFLTDEVVAVLGESGLTIVTVRAATLATVAPGLATPRSVLNLKMVDVDGEPVAIHGWAMPVEDEAPVDDVPTTRTLWPMTAWSISP